MEATTEQIDVRRATAAEKLILQHLMQLYSYDFAEFDGSDTDEFGIYRYDYLDHYWAEKTRYPYLVRVAGKLAGFALVKLNKREDGTQYTFMAEFFVMRKYRGKGIGQAVAFHLFDLHPGEWEVAEVPKNVAAQAFWRKIIGRYTNGHFKDETFEGREIVQTFISRVAA